jgi:hypothetical protein
MVEKQTSEWSNETEQYPLNRDIVLATINKLLMINSQILMVESSPPAPLAATLVNIKDKSLDRSSCVLLLSKNEKHLVVRRYYENGPLILFDPELPNPAIISNQYWDSIDIDTTTFTQIDLNQDVILNVLAQSIFPKPAVPIFRKPAVPLELLQEQAKKDKAKNVDRFSELFATKGVKIYKGPFADLKSPVTYLQDDIIDAYLMCINKNKRVLLIPATTSFKIFSGDTNINQNDNLTNYDQIAMPLLINGNHWTCALINNCTREFIYINPFIATDEETRKQFELWRQFSKSRKEFKLVEWKCKKVIHSVQKDSVNCGVFICIFIQRFIEMVQDFTFDTNPENLLNLRRHIANTLIENKD